MHTAKDFDIPNDQIISILMGTFNGAKYLSDQIESIISQDYINWNLYIRDDGSTDETVQIIQQYSIIDSRIIYIPDIGYKNNYGAGHNFSRLLEVTPVNSFTMFADQDDFWRADKISKSFQAMWQLEAAHEEEPCLIFTNFTYVDDHLKEITSKVDFSVVKSNKIELKHALVQSLAYGCTMMINKSLRILVTPVPVEAIIHDYWILLVAAATGNVQYLPHSSILYRQHGSNVSGTYKASNFKNRVDRLFFHWEKMAAEIDREINLAILLRDNFKLSLTHAAKIELNKFISLGSKGGLGASITLFKSGYQRQRWYQSLVFYILIITRDRKNVVDITT